MSTLINDPLFPAFVVLSIITLVLTGLVVWMYMKLKRFIIGVDSHNISDSLSFVSSSLSDLQSFRKNLEDYLSQVEKRLKKSVQSVHTVRFNPYKGVGEGGNQSFATAILNEHGDGVVISSLHSRDHIRVFSKPLKNLASEFELSGEEREAIEQANNNIKI